MKRLGMLTAGGDAPGLNAVIRAVVKAATNAGFECVGIEDSFDGLIESNRSRILTPREVTGILRLGGTILGTVLDSVARAVRARDALGARFSIVVVAEGACAKGGTRSVRTPAQDGSVERLGGIGLQVADAIERLTGKETRAVVLGHLQRGGAPTSFDRVLATRFGAKAVDLVRAGTFGHMVADRPPDIVSMPIAEVVGRTKTIPPDHGLLTTARAIGLSFGE
ncbi:MAG TPA: 6-phosphofructokinase [Vicinamibacterales bacterium]|jgi:6-phosphofructokinase